MPKKIKVLHFSTHNENCGIGKYQELFIENMQHAEDIEHTYFQLSPNQTKVLSKPQLDAAMDQLAQQAKSFDIVHVQHEISFFKHDELAQIMRKVHAVGKPVVVTVHAAPEPQYNRALRGGIGPRSQVAYVRAKRAEAMFLEQYVLPLRSADLVIAHNQATKRNLIDHGVDGNRIQTIKMPVKRASFKLKTSEVKRALRRSNDDIIFCTVGFLTEMKGILQAVKALTFLPENYKLAILGGVHPDGGISAEAFLDHVCDVVAQEGLQERVYISGYVNDDEQLDALIRECDISVYPYDRRYYAYVSSAALNLSLSNYKPTIAYPTLALLELNHEMPVVTFCKSANYYELAREIRSINRDLGEKNAKQYAELYAYEKEADKLADIYRQFLKHK